MRACAPAKVNLGPHTPSAQTPPLLLTRDDVANVLGIRLKQLTWWVYALDDYKQYKTFDIARHNGQAPRRIYAPIKPIKDIQRSLAALLLDWYEPPQSVHGFVTGRSAVTNARVHQRQEWVFRADIEDFFPAINFGRVYGMFKSHPFDYPREVAALLAQICCFDNQLPQGAPTSPIVSNYICRGLDADLANLARSERCYYSRYADDLCFSTRRRQFPTSIGLVDDTGAHQAGAALKAIIGRHGFTVQDKKTRLVRRTQRQRVTGLVVNSIVNVDRRYVRSLRAVLYIWQRYGQEEAARAFDRAHARLNWPPEKDQPAFPSVIRGRIQHVGFVKGWGSSIYRDLAHRMQKIDPTFAPSTLRVLHRPVTVRVYTEGETDIIHLQAAKAYFDKRDEFKNLRFEFPPDAATGGSAQLLKHCEALAVTPQSVPCVCVFDRDEDRILRQAVGTSDAKDHGNDVFAVAIRAPEWRAEQEPLTIEMLYKDEDLQRRDKKRRRLYLSKEFDRERGRHGSEPVYVLIPKKDGLIREEVLRAEDGESVGLTKMAFAENVRDGATGFVGVSFEGFRPTFALIEEAVARFSRLSGGAAS